MKYVNINTQATTFPVPFIIDFTQPPTHEQMLAHGWRQWDETYPPTPEGYVIISSSFEQDPNNPNNAIVVCQYETIVEQEEKRKQARIAAFLPLVPQAAIFKLTLRRHFGENAETNRNVTSQTVMEYFTQKQISQTITSSEISDAIMLEKLFNILSTWNGTGETWTLPWEIVP